MPIPPDGIPCKDSGCLSHISHPCEVCGRIGGGLVKNPPQLDLDEAFRIAVQVHGRQRDKSGEPYMGHICRVMSGMNTDEERVVAILHDALEDCPKHDQKGLLHHIWHHYGKEVAEAVATLTHLPEVEYGDYIQRVNLNHLARKVKISDLLDNSNPTRLAKLSLFMQRHLKGKYDAALEVLQLCQSTLPKENDHETQSAVFPHTDVLPAGQRPNSEDIIFNRSAGKRKRPGTYRPTD